MITPFRERAPDLDGRDPAALADAARVAAEGVTFGEGPFLLDPLPRVISAADWALLEAGLLQRVRALDAFCADVYGERRIVRDGVVPARVVETIDTLEPSLCGTSQDRWVAIAGLDVVRAPDGRFLVLEDNLRTPSGMAYAVAARVTTQLLLEPEHEPVPVDGLRDMLRLALGDGRAVVLTDGPSNVAFWEHERLAELLEIPLAEADGFDPSGVDVVYRRTNAWQLDSPLGRALHGRVRVVNAYGIGVGDDKLAHAYVEDMVRYYLGEEAGLGSVRTYDLGRPEVAEEVLDRIEELVVKPRAGYGGEGVVICPHASRSDVEKTREQVRAAPEDFIAQELIPLSEHPTVIDGEVVLRHVDLRPFVFLGAGDEGAVYPGGLTRVALDEGALVVNSSQNGGAKDTWVL